MDATELSRELIEAFPPGTEDVLDFDDDPGRLLLGMAQVLKAHGTDRADVAHRESTPLTCIDQMPAWEAALGLTATDLAHVGSLSQRRAQVFARLREFGPPTLQTIRSIIAPLLDYADASQLAIVEVSRPLLRAAHTYAWSGSLNFNAVSAQLSWRVADDAKVSASGAQVDLTFTHAELANVGVALRAPDGRYLFPDGTTPGPTCSRARG